PQRSWPRMRTRLLVAACFGALALAGCNGSSVNGPVPLDSDCDGVANVDDADDDDDGVADGLDNCPTGPSACSGANPDQSDPDADGRGAPCDVCPTTYDPAQADQDSDFVGDACD